jgi:hypothetical protein
MPLSPVEQEIIVLKGVWDMIDGMVNFGVFCKPKRLHDTNLMFEDAQNRRLFAVLLVDFLSQPKPGSFGLPSAPPGAPASDTTFLFFLREIARRPLLGPDAAALSAVVDAFADWLDEAGDFPGTWLPSLNAPIDLKVQRIAFLKTCGDIAKHTFARLDGRVKTIQKIMADNGRPVDDPEAYALIDEFQAVFHDDVLIYHSSTIAEFLNEIRWAIYDYLLPEFHRSYEGEDFPLYRFIAPADCANPLPVRLHWDLMNDMRREPYFPRFTVTKSLKGRY